MASGSEASRRTAKNDRPGKILGLYLQPSCANVAEISSAVSQALLVLECIAVPRKPFMRKLSFTLPRGLRRNLRSCWTVCRLQKRCSASIRRPRIPRLSSQRTRPGVKKENSLIKDPELRENVRSSMNRCRIRIDTKQGLRFAHFRSLSNSRMSRTLLPIFRRHSRLREEVSPPSCSPSSQ